MNKTLKTIVHVVLFVAAFIIFYLGLGVGLAVNPTGGTVLWILAAAIAIGNLLWIFYPRLQKK